MDAIRYRHKLGYGRRYYRLTRHGMFVAEYKTPEEPGRVVNLAELDEDEASAGT